MGSEPVETPTVRSGLLACTLIPPSLTLSIGVVEVCLRELRRRLLSELRQELLRAVNRQEGHGGGVGSRRVKGEIQVEEWQSRAQSLKSAVMTEWSEWRWEGGVGASFDHEWEDDDTCQTAFEVCSVDHSCALSRVPACSPRCSPLSVRCRSPSHPRSAPSRLPRRSMRRPTRLLLRAAALAAICPPTVGPTCKRPTNVETVSRVGLAGRRRRRGREGGGKEAKGTQKEANISWQCRTGG